LIGRVNSRQAFVEGQGSHAARFFQDGFMVRVHGNAMRAHRRAFEAHMGRILVVSRNGECKNYIGRNAWKIANLLAILPPAFLWVCAVLTR
jgi:hypothetical protein